MPLALPCRRAPRAAAVLSFAASSFAALLPGPARAADEVVVTASREPLAPHRVAADVVVIDAGRIRDSGADSLEDLLRREAGLQLTRNGGPGQNAGVFIRGASSGQTLLVIDGARIGAATLGQPEFDLLSLGSIERIEVLRGPASSLYGADAIGGVVQVFTRRGQGAPQVALRLAAGGYGAREASAAADARIGAVDLAAGVARETLRGVSALRPGDLFGNHNPDADGATRRSATAQIGVVPAAGQRLGLTLRDSRLLAQYDGSEFLPPAYVQDAGPDFRSRARIRQVVLEGVGTPGPAWRVTARIARDDSERTSGANAPDRFASRRDQAVAQASWTPAPQQQLTLALERVEERAESSSYLAPAARDNDAAVVAYAGRLGLLALQAELRRDRNSAYGRVDTGRLGVRWPLGVPWSLRVLAGDSFRAPSFNDLVFPGYGVPTLAPERGRSIEAGLDWRRGADEASLTVFRNALRDLIGYEPAAARCPPGPAYAFGCASNVARARLQGATLSGATGWRSGGAPDGPGPGAWTLRATLDWLDARDRATDARLPRRAASQQSVALGWRSGAWSAGAELLRVGGRPDAGIGLPAETTLDLQAGWRFARGWTAQARLLNATDRDLQPQRDYQGLGRQAWLVLRREGGW